MKIGTGNITPQYITDMMHTYQEALKQIKEFVGKWEKEGEEIYDKMIELRDICPHEFERLPAEFMLDEKYCIYCGKTENFQP